MNRSVGDGVLVNYGHDTDIRIGALVPYLESPVTYYAAQTDSRDEFESLCNKPERSFLVNFHSKGLAIFS